jgi:hypothetical protein
VDQGANLTLACGTTYYINSLTINSGGRVSVDTSCGPARIFVKSLMTINNGWLIDTDTTIQGDILVGYTGSIAVSPGVFSGTLVAPKAKVSVANAVFFRGAIFALTVEVHQGSTLLHFPFNFPWVI